MMKFVETLEYTRRQMDRQLLVESMPLFTIPNLLSHHLLFDAYRSDHSRNTTVDVQHAAHVLHARHVGKIMLVSEAPSLCHIP